MGKLAPVWFVSALTLFACVDKGTPSPTVQGGGGDSPTDTAVCATCPLRAGGETADFGASSGEGGGSSSCASVEAPLTDEVKQAFELEQLRTFLASPRVVVAQPRMIPDAQPALEGPIEIELKFELGEFTYRMGTDAARGASCDSVWAPVKLTANVGDGLLSFSASGGMFKQADALNAFMYASADLATATGSYRPFIDTSRPHAGQIEVSIYVYTDQLRGEVLPELLYFQSEEVLTSWLQRKPPPVHGLAGIPSITALTHLVFPADDCNEHELTLSLDTASVLLGGRSPAQLRSDVLERIGALTPLPAVWKDASDTVVRLEQAPAPDGAACASTNSSYASASGPELQLKMPVMTTLRTDDGKVDTVLDQLLITIGRENAELRAATLRGFKPNGQALDSWINYSFREASVEAEGIVHFLIETTPGGGTYGDCVAFPPGGKSDKDDCRYVRRL